MAQVGAIRTLAAVARRRQACAGVDVLDDDDDDDDVVVLTRHPDHAVHKLLTRAARKVIVVASDRVPSMTPWLSIRPANRVVTREPASLTAAR